MKNLETKILAFLIEQKPKDILNYIDKLYLEEWSKEGQEFISKIQEYALTENKDSIHDWLIEQDLKRTYLAEIFSTILPSSMGEEKIKELNELQQQAKNDRILKSLIGKPVQKQKAELAKLAQSKHLSANQRTLLEVAKERVKEKRLEKTAPSTGYKDLDFYILGFIPGHVYTLSGDTNSGKSTLALNFAYRVSQQNKKTLYFALEPENTVVDYLASIRLEKPFAELTEKDILYDDPNIRVCGKQQIQTIEDMIDEIQTSPRFDLVVIDHIGYFTTNTSNLTAKQSDVMKDIAGLAKAKNCAIMLIQHLNKSKTDKASPENNITGSASFKQDATDVLILLRDKEENVFGAYTNKDTGAIMVRKAKTANPQGVVPVKFHSGTAVITDDYEIVDSLT